MRMCYTPEPQLKSLKANEIIENWKHSSMKRVFHGTTPRDIGLGKFKLRPVFKSAVLSLWSADHQWSPAICLIASNKP